MDSWAQVSSLSVGPRVSYPSSLLFLSFPDLRSKGKRKRQEEPPQHQMSLPFNDAAVRFLVSSSFLLQKKGTGREPSSSSNQMADDVFLFLSSISFVKRARATRWSHQTLILESHACWRRIDSKKRLMVAPDLVGILFPFSKIGREFRTMVSHFPDL